MAAEWKINVYNSFAIDLGKNDIYGLVGDSFDAYYVNNAGEVVNIGDLDEAIKPLDNPASTTLSADVSSGDTEIPVDDASGFSKGMVAKVGSAYFYVQSVDTTNNILTARAPITDSASSGDNVDQVGNTGIYGTKVKMTEIGSYIFVINNPSIDLMNRATKIQVIRHTTSEVYDKLVDIEDKIDTIEGVEGIILA